MIFLGVGLREYDESAGDAAVSDELLGAVEHVITAVLRGSRLHGRGIRAAAWLRQRVCGDPVS